MFLEVPLTKMQMTDQYLGYDVEIVKKLCWNNFFKRDQWYQKSKFKSWCFMMRDAKFLEHFISRRLFKNAFSFPGERVGTLVI